MAAERKIGATVYRCEKLPAEQGLDLFLRVTKLFRVMPDLLGSIVAKDASKVAISTFMAVVLSDELDRDEAKRLLIELVQTCQVGSDPCIVGVKPADMSDVVKVAWFAMEAQFKDFLAESLVES